MNKLVFANCANLEIKEICKLDAAEWSSDESRYVSENEVSYLILLGTWTDLIDDLMKDGGVLSRVILRECQKRGLFPVIGECMSLAKDIVKNTVSYCGSSTSAMGWIRTPFQAYVMSSLTAVDGVEHILQILRYAKRFAPVGADKARHNAMQKFFAINKRCRGLCRRNPSRWEDSISDNLKEMCRYFREEFNSDDDIKFSNGSSLCGKTLAEKAIAYAEYEPCVYHTMYPISSAWREWNTLAYAVKPTAVPKNLESWRIIAPEHPYAIAKLQRVRRALTRSLSRSAFGTQFEPDNQDTNRALCRDGSLAPSYATIDLSSASDSIIRAFAYRVFPCDVLKEVDPYLARYFETESGSYTQCAMFASSGNPITFVMEGMLFLSICQAVTDYVSLITQEELLPPHVFGDDMLVDIAVFDTVNEVLADLGFIVNVDKSYAYGTTYRESCGVEYLDGYPIQSIYFPRKQLYPKSNKPKDRCDTYESLVSLQHRLFPLSMRAAMELQFCIEDLYGCKTSSVPGTDSSDPWGTGQVTLSKAMVWSDYKGQIEPYMLREKHMGVARRWVVEENSNVNSVARPIIDMIRYTAFLKHGPVYENPLMETLGISMPVGADTDFFGKASDKLVTMISH